MIERAEKIAYLISGIVLVIFGVLLYFAGIDNLEIANPAKSLPGNAENMLIPAKIFVKSYVFPPTSISGFFGGIFIGLGLGMLGISIRLFTRK